MESPFIHIENLNFSYPNDDGGESEVLHGLNLDIARGELVAVLGHNGSGKSTLAKLLNLILSPKSGRIVIDGLDITAPDLTEDRLFENRRNVGMVFQNPDNQLVATVVEEDVAFGPENLGVEPAEIRRRVDDALKTVGMSDFAKHSPHQLSGGQKQRVAIAGIIAMMPRCIIFDESTAMLDPQGRREVMDTILRLNRDYGITILHITHYMNEAALCNRVIVINDGKIELDGSPAAVFSEVAKLERIGLDVPQTAELLYELNTSGVRRSDGRKLPLCLSVDDAAAEIRSLFGTDVGSAHGTDVASAHGADVGSAHGTGVGSAHGTDVASAHGTDVGSAHGTDVGSVHGTDAAIELKNVSYVYSPNTPFCKTALDDVSLTIHRGVITGLMGHTGSGKSTLVQLLNGLNRPTAGQVLVDGEDIWADPKKVSRFAFRVGLVFQYPEYQLFEETVRRDIAFGPANMGLSADEIARRVEDAALFCGIAPELLDKSPFDLSGGQKRRVAIAGIMAMEPEVLVLDEPAAGLDPRGREEILGGIRSYQRKRKNTVIIVSHSMEDMARYSDEIIAMNQARVYMQGTTAEIFDRAEELTAIGLDVPQITELTDRLRRDGLPLRHGIYTVENAQKEILALLAHEKGQLARQNRASAYEKGNPARQNGTTAYEKGKRLC